MLYSTVCGHGGPFTWVAEGLGFCYHPDALMWYPWTLTRPVLPGHASFHLVVSDDTNALRLPAWHWQPVYSEEAARAQLRAEVVARFASTAVFVALPPLESYMEAFQ